MEFTIAVGTGVALVVLSVSVNVRRFGRRANRAGFHHRTG